jgi:hypothetical protein
MQAWSVRRTRLFSRGTEHGCLHPFAGCHRSGSRLRHSSHVVGGRFAYIRTGPAGLAGARVAKRG